MRVVLLVFCGLLPISALLPEAAGRDVSLKESASKYFAYADLNGGAAIGADFLGRYLPVSGMTIYSDEYIFVEVAFFGAAGSRAEFKNDQFSLKVNGATLMPQAPGLVTLNNNFPTMESKPQIVFDGGAGDGQVEIGGAGRKPRFPGDDPAHTPGPTVPQAPTDVSGGQVPPKPQKPDDLVRAAEFPAGSHSLPAAGYLFFHFEGKLKKIKHAELVYKGPLGNAALTLR